MQRTFNYTGRKKIDRKQALFSFTEQNGGPPEFDVVLDLDSAEYPETASVFVEAYCGETRQRFNFGTVGALKPPARRVLDEIDLSGPTLFNVLVVDQTGRHGMLLASGLQFRADSNDDEDNRSSMFSVRTRPLGQLTWKVVFETGEAPELCLNSKIPNAIGKVQNDPVFQSLVLPAALREVLFYFVWNEDELEGNEYFERWMAFAAMFGSEKPDGPEPAEAIQWIDSVVSGFSEKFHLSDSLVISMQES